MIPGFKAIRAIEMVEITIAKKKSTHKQSFQKWTISKMVISREQLNLKKLGNEAPFYSLSNDV